MSTHTNANPRRARTRGVQVLFVALVAAGILTASALPVVAVPTPDSGPVAGGTSVVVDGPAKVVDVASDSRHTWILTDDGRLFAWSSSHGNFSGQVGNGTTTPQLLPVEVTLPGGVLPVKLATPDGSLSAHVLGDDGWVYGWGYGPSVGNGSAVDSPIPVPIAQGEIPGGVRLVDVWGTWALGDDGVLYGWGPNPGNGAGASLVPVAVAPGDVPTGVTARDVAFTGFDQNWLVGSDGKIYYWGGVTLVPTALPPGDIPTGTRILSVVPGYAGMYALGDDGWVYGLGYGMINLEGLPVIADASVPTRIAQGDIPIGVSITALAGGDSNLVMLGDDGVVYAGGGNDFGAAGNGTVGGITPWAATVQGDIPSGVAPVAVRAGTYDCFVIGSDGAVYGWGPNASTDLGGGFDGTATLRSSPTLGPHFVPQSMLFDGVAGASLSGDTLSATSVTPAHAPGPVDVVVESMLFVGSTATSYTWSVTYPDGFTYVADVLPPVITTLSLPDGVVGSGYSQQVQASGSAPITFVVASGELPPGLTLDPVTGVVSGTPTQAGSFEFTVSATNVAGSDTQAYTVVVTLPVVPNSDSTLAWTGGVVAWWPAALATLVIATGLLALAFTRRRHS